MTGPGPDAELDALARLTDPAPQCPCCAGTIVDDGTCGDCGCLPDHPASCCAECP